MRSFRIISEPPHFSSQNDKHGRIAKWSAIAVTSVDPLFSSHKQNPTLKESRETFGKLLHDLFLEELSLRKSIDLEEVSNSRKNETSRSDLNQENDKRKYQSSDNGHQGTVA